MDLKDFIAETLQQIVQGVKTAQTAVQEHGAEINPHLIGDYKEHAKHGGVFQGSCRVDRVFMQPLSAAVARGRG